MSSFISVIFPVMFVSAVAANTRQWNSTVDLQSGGAAASPRAHRSQDVVRARKLIFLNFHPIHAEADFFPAVTCCLVWPGTICLLTFCAVSLLLLWLNREESFFWSTVSECHIQKIRGKTSASVKLDTQSSDQAPFTQDVHTVFTHSKQARSKDLEAKFTCKSASVSCVNWVLPAKDFCQKSYLQLSLFCAGQRSFTVWNRMPTLYGQRCVLGWITEFVSFPAVRVVRVQYFTRTVCSNVLSVPRESVVK